MLAFRNIAGNLRCADNNAVTVLHRRNRQGNIDASPVFAYARRVEMFDALAAADAGENLGLLLRSIWRYERQDRLADHLRCRVAEQLLGAVIPGGDDAIESFADNGIVGGFNHRREPAPQFFGSLALGDIGADGDVLPRAAARPEKWDDGGVDPVERSILGAVLDLSVPNPAHGDNAIHLPEEVLGVMAGVENAVVLAD